MYEGGSKARFDLVDHLAHTQKRNMKLPHIALVGDAHSKLDIIKIPLQPWVLRQQVVTMHDESTSGITTSNPLIRGFAQT